MSSPLGSPGRHGAGPRHLEQPARPQAEDQHDQNPNQDQQQPRSCLRQLLRLVLELTLLPLVLELYHHGFAGTDVGDGSAGIGIDEANLDIIFEKLYQLGTVELHSSGRTSFKGGGPGLGLAIVKHLVESHGGWIEAESQVGKGTIVRFTLPSEPPAAGRPACARRTPDG